MHIQQQQQQQLLASQNGTLFGSQPVFMQSPMTTGSTTPSESKLLVFLLLSKQLNTCHVTMTVSFYVALF